jgi:hypothetical protein
MVKCLNCKINEVKKRGYKYCSIKCSNSSKIKIEKINKSKKVRKEKFGNLFSDEARKRMSDGAKKRFEKKEEREKNSNRIKEQYKNGRIHPQGMLGKVAWNKGKENERWQGKNNPNFNNWSSYKNYGKDFSLRLKAIIRKRDNFRCQECGLEEKDCVKQFKEKLNIHHIDYNKKNNIPENLISLCRRCHSKTNYKRVDWEKYYNQKLVMIYAEHQL